MDFGIKCIWMPKGCAHIASTKSTEYPEPRNQGTWWAIQSGWFVLNTFAYVQQVSLLLEGTTWKSVLWYKFYIEIYMTWSQVKSKSIKKWSIYWVMWIKYGKHLSACEGDMQDHSMLDWFDSLNEFIVTVYRYVKLLITVYNYLPDVDSKLGQLIHLLWRVILKQNLRN